MDLLIFSISVVLLFLSRKMEWPIIGMLVLANDYLGIGKFFKSHGLNFYQPKDFALVLMILIFITALIRYKPRQKPYEIQRLNNYFLFFFVYLILTIVVDFIGNGIDAWSVFRTSRHWLLMLIFIPLMRLPSDTLERVIKIFSKLTLIVSFIIVFEYITGMHFFTRNPKTDLTGAIRGALPSTYALFYVLLVAMGYGPHKKWIRYAIVALLGFSLLLSAAKSVALGLFLGFIILVFLKSKSFFTALTRIIGVGLVAIAVVAIMPNLRTRLIHERQSFGAVDDGSATFRIILAEERLKYVANDPLTFVFGIGNVTEDNFQGYFKIGHINAEGEQAQLDTGDIAWALAFLRLGIVGTLIWTGLSFMFVWCFRQRKNDFYSIPLISYLLLNLIVLSLASTTIYDGSYWIVPLICLNIVYPTEQKTFAV